MLYPARMKEVTIIVHSKYITQLINRLHETNLIEITELSKNDQDFSKVIKSGKSHEETVKCISSNLRVNRILDIFDRVAPPPEGLFKSFTRPEPRSRYDVRRKETAQLFAETESTLKQIEGKVLDIDSQLNSLDEQFNSLEQQKGQIRLLRPIRFNLDYLGTSKHLIIKAGTVDSLQNLKDALSDLKDVTYRYSAVDEKFSVVIAAHVSQQEALDTKLRGRFFTEFDISGFKGTPNEVLGKLDAQISAIKTKKENLLGVLKKLFSAWDKKLLILDEELDNEKSRKEVFSRFGETSNTKVITGWVLKKKQDALEKLCLEVTAGHVRCHFKDPATENKQVPVKLENPRWVKPFEVLTTLFATPKYNEIDPTLIIAIPFVFFFGLMLGDAGYGMVIFILCLFGYFSLGKTRPVVKQASYIGIFMGFSTIVFGILMGTAFGDLIPRLIYGDASIPLYKAKLLGFSLPYDPIRDPIFLLQVSLTIGVSYIMLSIISAALHDLKYKNYRSFFLSRFPWFILVPFGILLIFYAFFDYEFSPLVLNVSYLMIVFGLVLLFIDKKMLFFFDITGYLGDSLSFARLLALGLATAGIAMTINIIAELVIPVHPVMIILVFVLLFFGHLINFMLQALGAGIHSLRLQYVEFFGRCYEGGGKPYEPFQAKRLITKLDRRK